MTADANPTHSCTLQKRVPLSEAGRGTRGDDAARNSTTTYKNFENKHWYSIRLRVTPNRLEAWLENEQIVNIDTSGKIISTRGEVDLNKPFGFASYQSTAAIRNVKIHPVDGPASPKPDF